MSGPVLSKNNKKKAEKIYEYLSMDIYSSGICPKLATNFKILSASDFVGLKNLLNKYKYIYKHI